MYPNVVCVALFVAIGFTRAVTVQHYHNQHEHTQHHKSPPIPILKQHYEQSKEGWKFSYETGNGIHAQEVGYIKNLGDKKHEIVVQKGSVTYHDKHGHPITLQYVADEHGFQPKGSHLPTPPPIPHELQKSIEEHHQAHQAVHAHHAAIHSNHINHGHHQQQQQPQEDHHQEYEHHQQLGHQEIQAHQPVFTHHAILAHAQHTALGHQEDEAHQQVEEEQYDQHQYGHY